jgi:hypothetical protein
MGLNKGILKKAIKIYGEESQIDMMIEEMSELTKALCKLKRHRKDGEATCEQYENVLEEVADVKIMLVQMEMIFDFDAYNKVDKQVKSVLDRRIGEKISRLEKRLGGKDCDQEGI